jgi:bisphosphoglycerate-independent phosphoglycerate mutase (AlkP superfamily)
MAKEIFPSSYKCDCGYECHFFESTIEEMKKMSEKKQVRLCDSEDAEHTIVFVRGKAKELLCPTLGKCIIVSKE